MFSDDSNIPAQPPTNYYCQLGAGFSSNVHNLNVKFEYLIKISICTLVRESICAESWLWSMLEGVDIKENDGCISEGNPWFLQMVYSLKGIEH